jgi:sugar O-acyltransferase (sialic acid O-acetyltransferase NeuD family)
MPTQEQIILIGGGGHCKACIDVIEAEAKFKIAGIVDVKEKAGQKVLGYKIIASDENLLELAKEYRYFFITIGQTKSPTLRIDKFSFLKSLAVELPVILSPLAYISKNTCLEEGTIVMHRAVVNADARIGKNCIINTGAIIEHDVVIEEHCHISTGAIVNGGAVIKRNSFIGSNSMIREYIEVGQQCVIGGGGVIMKNVSAYSVVRYTDNSK